MPLDGIVATTVKPFVLLDRESTARQPAAAVFSCAGGALRRHGAPQRKDRPRKPGGRIRANWAIDHGHEATLSHREALVGKANSRDHRSGYPLGALFLMGKLAEPRVHDRQPEEASAQNEARHAAGLYFAADHQIVWGSGSPKSHLASIIDGIRHQHGQANLPASEFVLRAAARYGRKVAAVRLLPGPSNPFPFHVLQRIAVDEQFQLNEIELSALRRALQALADLDK